MARRMYNVPLKVSLSLEELEGLFYSFLSFYPRCNHKKVENILNIKVSRSISYMEKIGLCVCFYTRNNIGKVN